MFDLTGRVIVVTGAAGLLGKEAVRALRSQGAAVAALDVAEESAWHEDAPYVRVDVTDRDSLFSARDAVLSRHGRIDGLVTLAALNPAVGGVSAVPDTRVPFEEMPLDAWERELNVNLTGTMLSCQIFGSSLRRGGSVVTVSSIYGLVAPDQRIYPAGFVKPPGYSVSKAGIVALTKYLAAYWGEKGIRVNCVAPGGVENGQDAEFVKRYASRAPMGRMAAPSEFGGILVYLLSDASSYATGAVFSIDGGWTAW